MIISLLIGEEKVASKLFFFACVLFVCFVLFILFIFYVEKKHLKGSLWSDVHVMDV